MYSNALEYNTEMNTILDFEAEELQKKLKYSMANFAQLKFIKQVQTRVLTDF